MVTLKPSKLTLNDVHRLLKFQERLDEIGFAELLRLEPLTELERQELHQIRDDFRAYLRLERASEGQVKALTTFPLLRLAGFYRQPVQINAEEGIDEIAIADEDITITGRFDIVAINTELSTASRVPFWIVVIESKESGIEVRQGLPQLLTYAYKSLKQQASVWGLVTNGLQYLFVYLRQGESPTYQALPILDLMYSQSGMQLLQVLKALCQLQLPAA